MIGEERQGQDTMKDRRQYQRFTTDILDMHGKRVFARDVRILDMSVGGVLLNTNIQLNTGKQCIFRTTREGSVLNQECVVVWSSLHKSTTPGIDNSALAYKTGLRFINMSKEKMLEIIRFIEAHSQGVDKQGVKSKLCGYRMNVRVHIQSPEKSILIFHEGFRIKNLSFGGMLTESADPLDIGATVSMKILRSETKSITVLGKVASCSMIKRDNHEYYDIGIVFLKMTEKDRELLKELMCLLETMCCIAPSTLP
jgi:c-di-GMP-binding flagellar brake protein YcgR